MKKNNYKMYKIKLRVVLLGVLILVVLLFTCLKSPYQVYEHHKYQEEKYEHPFSNSLKDMPNNLECLTSVNDCLTFIKMSTGKEPVLMSFAKPREFYKTNQKTGQVFLVPNIVHYINFGRKQPFVFYNYVAYMALETYIKPDLIILWGDMPPHVNNTWWQKTRQNVPNIYYLDTKPYDIIAGKNVTFIEHSSDMHRLEILTGKGNLFLAI